MDTQSPRCVGNILFHFFIFNVEAARGNVNSMATSLLEDLNNGGYERTDSLADLGRDCKICSFKDMVRSSYSIVDLTQCKCAMLVGTLNAQQLLLQQWWS